MRPDPETLARTPLFASLSTQQVRAVASLMEVRSEPAGARLVGEDAPGYSLFVLQEGTAEVAQGNETLTSLQAGDFFGEIALLGESRRTASVTATSPVSVATMAGSDFAVLERDFPDIARQVRQAMADRLARSRNST